MALVMVRKYAMYNYLPSIRTQEEYLQCKITDVGFSLKNIQLAFAIQKNSPFLLPLNRALAKMMENGEVERFKKKNLGKLPECVDSGKGRSIGLPTIVFPIGICTLGITASILLIFLEFVVHRISKKICSKFTK